MSIRLMSMVWENGPERTTDRFLLLAIADGVNDHRPKEGTWPSMDTLAARCCLTRRGAQLAIRRMAAEGWLEVVEQPGRSNRYVVVESRFGRGEHSSPPTDDGGERGSQGGEPDDTGGVNVVRPNQKKNQNEPEQTLDQPGPALVLAPDPQEPTPEDWWDLFWQHYPRRVGKAKARTAFMAAVKRGTHPGQIVQGLAAQHAALSARETQYQPHPATWLHQQRWDDDPGAVGRVRGNPFADPWLSESSATVAQPDPPALRSNPWT